MATHEARQLEDENQFLRDAAAAAKFQQEATPDGDDASKDHVTKNALGMMFFIVFAAQFGVVLYDWLWFGKHDLLGWFVATLLCEIFFLRLFKAGHTGQFRSSNEIGVFVGSLKHWAHHVVLLIVPISLYWASLSLEKHQPTWNKHGKLIEKESNAFFWRSSIIEYADSFLWK